MPSNELTFHISSHQYNFIIAASEGDLDSVKNLYENKTANINPNALSSTGVTPLFLAAQNNHLEVVKYLLTLKDIDVGLVTPFNQSTALHTAAFKGHLDIVDAILKTPAGLLHQNTKGMKGEYTPIYVASQNGHIEVVKRLLAAGADPNLKNNVGFTALDIASSVEMILLLDGCDVNIHHRINQYMKLLGFKANLKGGGLCFGFAEVAKLSALSSKKSRAHFYDTLFLLSSLTAKKLLEMHSFHESLLKQAELAALNELHVKTERALDEEKYKQFEKLTSEKLLLLRKNLSTEQQKIESDYLDILTLFNGIELEFQATKFPHLVNRRTTSQMQNPEWVTPLIQSEELEKKGGEALLANFTAPYTKKGLLTYFTKLRERIKEQKKMEEPIALLLLGSNHAITVIYDAIVDTWEIFDINKMPSKPDELKHFIIPGEEDFTDKIANAFFSMNGDVIFQTEISTTKNGKDSATLAIDKWREDLTPLHHMTPEKLKMVDSNKASWLYMAAKCGDDATVQALIKHKADVLGDEDSFKTIGNPLYIASQNGHEKIVTSLLSHPMIQPNEKVLKGTTSLSVAAQSGQTNVVTAFLESKIEIDINEKDDQGATALYFAVKSGYVDIVKLLLQKKDIDLSGANDGTSLLSVAAEFNRLDVIQALIAEKALELDPNEENENGMNALHRAAIKGNADIVNLLLKSTFKNPIQLDQKRGEVATPLYNAAQNGHPNIIQILAKAGADVNAEFSTGYTPAWIAAQNNHADVIIALHDAKANLDVPNQNGHKPIHAAIELGNIRVVKNLIDAKIDLNSPDAEGKTPLHWAIEYINGVSNFLNFFKSTSSYDMIDLFINAGADFNIKDNSGKLPIDYANDSLKKYLKKKLAHKINPYKRKKM